MTKVLQIEKNRKSFEGYEKFCQSNNLIEQNNIPTVTHFVYSTTLKEIKSKKEYRLTDYVMPKKLSFSDLFEKPEAHRILQSRTSVAVVDIKNIIPVMVLSCKASRKDRLMIPSVSEIWWVAESMADLPYRITKEDQDVTEDVLYYEAAVLNRMAHVSYNDKTYHISSCKSILMETLNGVGILLDEMVQ